MMKMMVRTGTRIFQYMATVLVRAIHLMPNRFSAVNTKMPAMPTAMPVPVSRPAGVSSPLQSLALT